MKLNKAPGIDGSSVEFVLKDMLERYERICVNTFNFSLENGELTNSQK